MQGSRRLGAIDQRFADALSLSDRTTEHRREILRASLEEGPRLLLMESQVSQNRSNARCPHAGTAVEGKDELIAAQDIHDASPGEPAASTVVAP